MPIMLGRTPVRGRPNHSQAAPAPQDGVWSVRPPSPGEVGESVRVSTSNTGRPVYDPSTMSSASLPVLVLTTLGGIIAVLAVFAGGELAYVIVGLSAVAVAGLLHVIDRR